MHIGIHPAPGFGEMMPAGSFVVPSNPIRGASYIPGIGELVAAKYNLPENPILRELYGASSLSPGGPRTLSMSGLGKCGCLSGMCGAGCEGLGMAGLGGLGCGGGGCRGMRGVADDLGLALSSLSGDSTTLILGGAAVLLVMWMLTSPGGKGYRADVDKAKSEYQSKVAAARSRHRGYKRLARPVAKRVQSGLRAVTT